MDLMGLDISLSREDFVSIGKIEFIFVAIDVESEGSKRDTTAEFDDSNLTRLSGAIHRYTTIKISNKFVIDKVIVVQNDLVLVVDDEFR